MNDTLFPMPPETERDENELTGGRPRLKRPNRGQLAFRPSNLEELVVEDHPVRLIWSFVEQLDLSPCMLASRRWKAVPGRARSTPDC